MDKKTQSKIDLINLKQDKMLRVNPIRNLTPRKLASLLEDFERGYFTDVAKLFYAISTRDDMTVAVSQKRKMATARLKWNIVKIDDKNLEVQANEHAKCLEYFYNNLTATSVLDANRRGGISLLFENMLECIGNQYSVHEITWKPSVMGLSAVFNYMPLWFFENTTGILRFKENLFDTYGTELNENEWLICSSNIALYQATAVAYLIKRLALGDWTVFSQRFGMATPVYKTKATVNSKEWKDAVNVVSNYANENGVVISSEEVFELLQANGQGSPMPQLVERMDRAIALLWRGSDLSTLSSQNGAGASLQADETNIFEDADARKIEEALEQYVSKFVIEQKFGIGVKPLAYITLQRVNRTDKRLALEIFERAASLGCPASKNDVYEALEIRKPENNEDVIAPVATTNMPQENISNSKKEVLVNEKNTQSIEDDLIDLAISKNEDIKLLTDTLNKINEDSNNIDEYVSNLEELQKKIKNYFNGGKNETDTWKKIFERNIEK